MTLPALLLTLCTCLLANSWALSITRLPLKSFSLRAENRPQTFPEALKRQAIGWSAFVGALTLAPLAGKAKEIKYLKDATPDFKEEEAKVQAFNAEQAKVSSCSNTSLCP